MKETRSHWLIASLAALTVLAQPQSAQPQSAPLWDTLCDTWVATDGLGRALPVNAQVGGPRSNKTVAMFYFLTHNQHATMGGPFNVSEILRAHPEALNDVNHPAWGPVGAAHHWGEPLFGYYASDDEYVLAKHGQMLANAGVDVVIFDVSNSVTYDKVYMTLCRVWSQMRRSGARTPQIAFLAPFGNPDSVSRTVTSLFENLYREGSYSDLWFRWNGKPLILANADSLDPQILRVRGEERMAAELKESGSLGQSFHAGRPFSSVGGEFPTWATTTSAMTLSLYRKEANGTGLRGKLLASRRFTNVRDNAALSLEVGTLPPGDYFLEISHPTGRIGWWSRSGRSMGAIRAFEDDTPVAGARLLLIRYANEAQSEEMTLETPLSLTQAQVLSQQMRGFFTFRAPIAPYNLPAPPPGQWSWLQIYPQAPCLAPGGELEEISVGVAQNYNATVNNTAPMSFPGAFGRSFHGGRPDTSPNAELWGFNFAEQWQRALQLDPPLVFVTGWNEWTAGRYNEWATFKAPPVIFVDQFNREYSRDIEPEKGGHGDNYYYQLIANIRRFKGARPAPTALARPIKIDARFGDWTGVEPEFRDAIGDPARRDHIGYGQAGPYKNTTGRNDIVACKASYNKRNVYFYARTQAPLSPRRANNWMLLFIDADQNPKTGWLGFDLVVNHAQGRGGETTIERNIAGQYRWGAPRRVSCRTSGNEMELAVPRALLQPGVGPLHFDFKWADNCIENGDWSDFTLNGDAAPDDRFNFRYREPQPVRATQAASTSMMAP